MLSQKIDSSNNNSLNTSNVNNDNNVDISVCENIADNNVYGCHKIVLEPDCDSYVKVKCKGISNKFNYLFVKDNKFNAFIMEDQIIKTIDNDEVGVQTSNNNLLEFYVYVSNNTSNIVHLNKGTKLGSLHILDHVQENNDNNSANVQVTCNVIQASDNILKLRKEQLSALDFNCKHLDSIESDQLIKLLLQNYSAFSKSPETIGHTDRVIPDLKFINDFPIKSLPFPVPYALQDECKEQISQLCEAGIIERNCSEWACPMLLVKKKSDGSSKTKYRLALDLRMINSVILGSSYPLPKIQTIISNLSAYKYFTSLDLNQAYHQVDLPKHLQDKITFTSIFGSFKYKRLVFGLKTAASTFQALMDTIIDEVNFPGIYAYQDDLIFGSNSFNETMEKLTKILSVFTKHNLTLSPSKCSFHKSSTDYLGFHIENNTISPITTNVTKIVSFPVPKTKRQLKRFIGLATFYKHLIPSFSKLIQPLIDLTSSKVTFVWEEQHQNAFKIIQDVFFSKPMVSLPDWSKKFYLSTDASGTAVSGTLQQMHHNELRPIAFYSKSLKPSQKNYPALKLELMALYQSITAFKYYLYNREFVVLSDSKPLGKYKKCTNPADIVTRWLMELSEYSFTFHHVPGDTNVLADYLSREDFTENQISLSTNPELINENNAIVPIDIETVHVEQSNCVKNVNIEHSNFMVTEINDVRDPLLEISNETFVKEQSKDSQLSVIYNEILNTGTCVKDKNYYIHPDTKVLMYKKYNEYNLNYQHVIVVPQSLKAKALAIAHVTHFGLQKTYNFLTAKYFWKGCYNDTLNFVASCTKCLQVKQHRTPSAPFQPTYNPKVPGHTIAIDLVGPFSTGHSILTITDHFTRHLELFALRSTATEKIVHCLLNYFTTFGRPSVILSDLGTQFTSQVYNKFNEMLGIKILHSSSAHPQSNAIAERVNASIKNSINILLMEGYNFEQAMLVHKSLYNGSKHSSTCFSPNLLHFGRELSLIFDTVDFSNNQPFVDNVDTYKFLNDLMVFITKLIIIVIVHNLKIMKGNCIKLN